MKERQILFSGPMVRALLNDTKTQTRRVVKPQPVANQRGKFNFTTFTDDEGIESYWQNYPFWGPVRCPYGQPGDRLWVRESWGYFDPDGTGVDYDRDHNDDGKAGPCTAYRQEMLEEGNALRNYWRRRIAYKATFAERKYGMGPVGPNKWRPSIHMPRWANRITLEITAVRVERLQDISEADAQAEGCPIECMTPTGDDSGSSIYGPGGYMALWNDINGPRSWDANPWVWVVEFKRITQ